MPFKFKLSKRLALMKAALAVSAALALACDRTDLTSPQAFPSPLTAAVTSLPMVSVVASGDDGNVAQNTVDNSLATRWSASGDGQWIRYDLGALMAVGRVDVAWYRGNEWASAFDIDVSPDAVTWTRVFSGQSRGQTLEAEYYEFPTVTGRYVRITGHGQWSGTTRLSLWNSITEVAVSDAAPSESVVASADDGNIPQNTLDKSLASRWSAYGDGQWIRYDLGALTAVGHVDIAWYRGNEWVSAFAIDVSPDAVTWTRVLAGRSSGQTLQRERYDFPMVTGRYVRITGHGQWSGTTQLSPWNSITEVAISDAAPSESVVASADDGNIPQNTLDKSLASRWSAYGDGQWIRYDLGALTAVGHLDIAWYRGNEWVSAFDIDVSPDAVTWTRAFAGKSGGQTLQPERYGFPMVTGRYVRITGHGQWSGTTRLSLWNSITEVHMHGSAAVAVAVNPGAVTDLAVVGVTDTAATLAFTGVNDGTGQPASYDVRFAVAPISWGATAPSVTGGTCATPLAGSAIGAQRTCTVLGLESGTTYEFQLIAFRGTLKVDPVFGALSNIARATTARSTAAVATVAISPASASAQVGQTILLSATTQDSAGNTLSGRTVTWATSNSSVATVDGSGLVTAVAAGSATITATSEGKNGTATITVTAPATTNPGTVTDLAVAGVPDTAATLAFTEVSDGTGQPASYDVRFAVAPISWGGSPSVTRGTCATPLAGSAIGARRTCTVLGLQAGTTYEFQLVAFRGTLRVDAVFGELSNIARATTASSTAPVATVTVSPATASVLLGATQQLSAVLRDANGNLLTGRSVTWSSSNPVVALVSSSGLVTGLVLGSATITATSEGKSGTAALTVASAGSGPQPGPTATIVFQDGFESGDLSSWTQSPNTGRYSVTTNAARVQSGTRSLQTLYSPTNTYGAITRWFMPGYDEIYVKFYVMFEEQFEHSMHFLTIAGNRIDDPSSASGRAGVVPNGTDFFYAGLDPASPPNVMALTPFSFYTYYPDMTCCYGNRFYQIAPAMTPLGGEWQEVVMHIKLNTLGQSNGSQTLWINGVKKIDVQNMRWRTTTDLTLNQIRFDNWMNTGDVSRIQHVWLDDLIVWRP